MRKESGAFIVERAVVCQDQEAVNILVSRLASWLAHGGDLSLARALRLPTTSAAVRQELRDRWLKRAAELIAPGQLPGPQGARLHEAVTVFMDRKWPLICHLNDDQVNLDGAEKALFRAALAVKSGDVYTPKETKMPTSRQQFVNILSE